MCALLQHFWDHQQIVVSQAGYYGAPFSAQNGLTQGGIVSPTVFNVVCDAVVREWLFQLAQDGNGVDAPDALIRERLIGFYADDGFLASRDPEWLQRTLTLLVQIFERVGLKTNAAKTKVMNFVPGHIRAQVSTDAYRKRTRERKW